MAFFVGDDSRRPFRGKLSRAAAVAWFLVSLAGCSAIAGLDAIQEESCAPDCWSDSGVPEPDGPSSEASSQDDGPLAEAGPDSNQAVDSSYADRGAFDSATGNDTSTMTDGSTGDSSPLVDSGLDVGLDVGPDSVVHDASGADTGVVDAPVDTSPPVEAGCGPTNTVQNCGACGASCTSTNASSGSCSGSACNYSCNSGFFDCNASVGHDTDGCECDMTASSGLSKSCSCGTSCPQVHNTGLTGLGSGWPTDIYFYDCNPLGSNWQGIAQDACANFTAGNTGTCDAPRLCPGTSADYVICARETGGTGSVISYPCWEYTGTNVGIVTVGTGGNLTNWNCPGDSQTTTRSYQ